MTASAEFVSRVAFHCTLNGWLRSSTSSPIAPTNSRWRTDKSPARRASTSPPPSIREVAAACRCSELPEASVRVYDDRVSNLDFCPNCGHIHVDEDECGFPIGGNRVCRCERAVTA